MTIETVETIEQYVDRRLRAEWPGTHSTPVLGIFAAPEIREGGATDLLVKMAARIAGEYEPSA